jgi:hypothetical protein
MYLHNIFLANAFRLGKRIAFDLVIKQDDAAEELDNGTKIQKFLTDIYKEIGADTVITTHTIVTNSEKWESVVAVDSFFQDILLIEKVEEFKKYLKGNKTLSKNDIKIFINLIVTKEDGLVPDRENLEKLIEDINWKYKQIYYGDLFKEKHESTKIAIKNEDIYKYSDVIIDRVLSSEDGFKKFKFIVNEVYKKMGKPIPIKK